MPLEQDSRDRATACLTAQNQRVQNIKKNRLIKLRQIWPSDIYELRNQEEETEFVRKYEKLFTDQDAQRVFASALAPRQAQFRKRMADILAVTLEKTDYEDKAFLSEHIAGAIIGWTMADVPFYKQYSIIKKLIS